MRKLWSEDSLDYTGEYHRIDKASINPRPSKTIPIWFGGSAPALLDRVARLGDGWIPLMGANDKAKACIDTIKQTREAAGLSFDNFSIVSPGPIRRWLTGTLAQTRRGLARYGLHTSGHRHPQRGTDKCGRSFGAYWRVPTSAARIVLRLLESDGTLGIQRHKRIKSCGQLVQVARKNRHHQLIEHRRQRRPPRCRHSPGADSAQQSDRCLDDCALRQPRRHQGSPTFLATARDQDRSRTNRLPASLRGAAQDLTHHQSRSADEGFCTGLGLK